MKKGFLGKVLLMICMLFGCMVGYGFVKVTGTGSGTIYNRITKTKDNTLDGEKDSVFFSSDSGSTDITIMPVRQLQKNDELDDIGNTVFIEDKFNEMEVIITLNPTITPKPVEEAKAIEEKETTGQILLITPTQIEEEKLEDSRVKEEQTQEEKIEIDESVISQDIVEETEQEINISDILVKGIKEKIENPLKETEKKAKENEVVAENEKENQKILEEVEKQKTETDNVPKIESAQTFTYPTEIFGQTPIVNRSDEYVTYFEFALDLIETVEAQVKEKGLSETALFAKFVVKALFCGVDIKAIQINAPIPRSKAALALWLTAQVMEEKASVTNGGTSYIMDLKNCSSSEKKAIAYLYEQGVISGYQVAGQTFSPSQNLKTKDGEVWMIKIKQCWK